MRAAGTLAELASRRNVVASGKARPTLAIYAGGPGLECVKAVGQRQVRAMYVANNEEKMSSRKLDEQDCHVDLVGLRP
jgi:hypothetical protein